MVRLFLAGAITLIFFATPGFAEQDGSGSHGDGRDPCAAALAFLAGPAFAQHDGGGSHGNGRDGGGDNGDRGSNDDGRGSFDGDRGEIGGDRSSFDDLHDRIDRAEGIGEEDKERGHQTVDTVKSEMDKVREATALVDKLQAEGLVANDPARKAEIEAEVKEQLDRIETGRATLAEIRRNLENQIDTSESLTREQKAEAKTILRDYAGKRITKAQAKLAVDRFVQDVGCASGYVLMLVLFILLVIIGAHG